MFSRYVTKIHQDPNVGYSLTPQIKPAELQKNHHIVECVLAGLIGQIELVLYAVNSQHAFQCHRRTLVAYPRVIRFHQRAELRPGHLHFHLRLKRRLSRRSCMFVESSAGSHCHLLHSFHPDVRCFLSNHLPIQTTARFGTYYVFS